MMTPSMRMSGICSTILIFQVLAGVSRRDHPMSAGHERRFRVVFGVLFPICSCVSISPAVPAPCADCSRSADVGNKTHQEICLRPKPFPLREGFVRLLGFLQYRRYTSLLAPGHATRRKGLSGSTNAPALSRVIPINQPFRKLFMHHDIVEIAKGVLQSFKARNKLSLASQ